MSSTNLQKSDEKLPHTAYPEPVDEKRDLEKHGGALPAGDEIPVETHDIFEDDSGVDPVYQAKARILNDAFQEIGMGRYQVRLRPLRDRGARSADGLSECSTFSFNVQAQCRAPRRGRSY